MHEVIDGNAEGGEPTAAVDSGHGAGSEAQQSTSHEAGIDGVLHVRFASVAFDDAFGRSEHEPDHSKVFRRRRNGVFHVNQCLLGGHGHRRLVGRYAGAEQAEEGTQSSTCTETHDSSKRTAFKDCLHHDFFAGANACRARRLRHYYIGIGTDHCPHQVLGRLFKLLRSEPNLLLLLVAVVHDESDFANSDSFPNSYNLVDDVTWAIAFSLAISWNSWNLEEILWFIFKNFSAQLRAQVSSPRDTFLVVKSQMQSLKQTSLNLL